MAQKQTQQKWLGRIVYCLNLGLWPASLRIRSATVGEVTAVRMDKEGAFLLHITTGQGRTYLLTESMLIEGSAFAPEGAILYPEREDCFMVPVSGDCPGKTNRRQVVVTDGEKGTTSILEREPEGWKIPDGRFAQWMGMI